MSTNERKRTTTVPVVEASLVITNKVGLHLRPAGVLVQTAAQFQVLSIPTMILFKAGEPVKTVIGAYPKKRLEQELEPALA